MVLPNIGALIIFFMTEQYAQDWWRIANFLYIFQLLSINGSAMGLMISSAMPENPIGVVFIGFSMLFPQILFSGNFGHVTWSIA